MRKFFVAIPIVMMAVSGTACATKKFVRTSVGEVNDKIEATNRSLEETQERTRRNEAKITEVDQKAPAAGTAAQNAQQSADRASSAAQAAVGARTRSEIPAIKAGAGASAITIVVMGATGAGAGIMTAAAAAETGSKLAD